MVAVAGPLVVGHIFFSPAVIASDRGEVTGMGLAPMAVHYDILCQWEVSDDAFMIRILDANRMEGVRGVAAYRSEFDAAM